LELHKLAVKHFTNSVQIWLELYSYM
jgi:hypothetical protein